ncbi:MAG TPA: hypothetical protein VFJ43_11595, partial [Bacteroidia bacterium]|nr:hypothetical protein [Bacteroidia bacterium]
MKFTTGIIILILTSFDVTLCRAQVIPPINTIEYSRLKKEGKLPQGPVIIYNKDTFLLNMQPKVQQPSS